MKSKSAVSRSKVFHEDPDKTQISFSIDSSLSNTRIKHDQQTKWDTVTFTMFFFIIIIKLKTCKTSIRIELSAN